MIPTYISLSHLSRSCAVDIGIGTAEILHPAFCSASDWGAGIAEQRRVVDMVCGLGVQYMDAKPLTRTKHDEERYLRKVRRRAERTAKERDHDKASAAGFAPLIFIGMSVVSWLIGQALNWLLRWWRSSDNATEVVKTLCWTMPGAGWQDDGEDD